MRTVAVSLLLVLPSLLLFAEAGQLKVLCLHGFASSASIFNMQLLHLQSAVSSFADLTFTDGFYPLDSTGSRRRPRFSWRRRQTWLGLGLRVRADLRRQPRGVRRHAMQPDGPG